MSRCILFVVAVMLCITACENPDLPDLNENQEQTGNDNKPSGGEGEGETESVKFMTITVERVSATKVVFKGITKKTAPDIEVGLYWSKVQGSHINDCEKVSTYKITNGSFELAIEDLDADTKYYCYPYLFMNGARELGDEFDFKTAQPRFTLDNVSVDGLTATFTGYADSDCSVGIYCSTSSPSGYNYKTHYWVDAEDNNYTLTLDELSSNTTYYYCTYVDKYSNDNPEYGTVKSFMTGNPTIIIDKVNVSDNQITFTGSSMLDCVGGILYSTSPNITIDSSLGQIDLSNKIGSFTQTVSLSMDITCYYCTYYYSKSTQSYVYGEVKSIKTATFPWGSATDLSAIKSANCYIVSTSGLFKIKAVKGNSSKSIGTIKVADVLWESFASTAPSASDLVQYVSCKDNYIGFKIHDDFKEGNALIAAKDANGKILWSWHIWLTDKPQEHIYKNNAGTMMDRNLGATSATPGDVGTHGLSYQWGRKDPFTTGWLIVKSDSSTDTIEYTIAHPTTFICSYSPNDNTLWTTSETAKSIYDPCPVGWRVPDGGENGVWSKAGFDDVTSDSTLGGISFSISSPSTTWYPSGSIIDSSDGKYYRGGLSYYWSASLVCGGLAYTLSIFNISGGATLSFSAFFATGCFVRCIKE